MAKPEWGASFWMRGHSALPCSCILVRSEMITLNQQSEKKNQGFGHAGPLVATSTKFPCFSIGGSCFSIGLY